MHSQPFECSIKVYYEAIATACICLNITCIIMDVLIKLLNTLDTH